MDTNHHLLCALQVSHPTLDFVYSCSKGFGFPCKLTGAGGGGCAITILPENKCDEEALLEDSLRLRAIRFSCILSIFTFSATGQLVVMFSTAP